MIKWPDFRFPPINLSNMMRTKEMQEIWFDRELVEMYYDRT